MYTAAILAIISTACAPESSSVNHGESNAPSSFTIARQEALRDSLPFDDRRDFDEQSRGFIAAPSYRRIDDESGKLVWDIGQYDFLLTDDEFDSIHPSLQRQATLNMNYGLYEVVPDKIYQVRGFDLSNMTLIKGDTGWIIFDVLLTSATAKAALELANNELGARPVVAVIYSHSHADHFGGIRGVVDEEDVRSGKVAVLAPRDFMEHVVAENVYAGNAMTRRATYQYGVLIPSNPFGQVDSAIGKATSRGTIGVIAPNKVIEEDFEEHTIDGVVPGHESVLGRREHYRHDSQHLYPARCPGARRTGLVQGDQ